MLRAIDNGNDVVNHRVTQIDSRFITTIQGKEFVLYAGLLDLAHQKGLKKLVVDVLQLPTQENDHTAICRAIAETTEGEVFTDVGDANETNTNKKVIHHLIRMASTRAKARCLRDLTNVGLCAVEELGDVNDDVPGPAVVAPRKAAANGYDAQNGNGNNGNGNGNGADQNIPKMSAAQRKAIENIATRRKISDDALSMIIHDKYGVTLSGLTSMQAAELIRTLQKAS